MSNTSHRIMNKKILITGTDGFIGSSLKHHFINSGFQVFGTTFFRTPNDEKEIQFDITQKEEFSKLWANEQFDIIVHAIGLIDQTLPYDIMYAVNTQGTEYMCEYAKSHGCKHFIFTSSVSVYGSKTTGENRTEKDTERKKKGIMLSPYGRTKAMAEEIIEKSGLEHTILRLPIVLGAGDTFISPSIVPRLLEGTMFTCEKKRHKISVLYVKNLGPIIEKLISIGPINRCVNCVADTIFWDDFLKTFAKNLKLEYKPKIKSFYSIFTHYKDKKYLFVASYSAQGAHYSSSLLEKILKDWQPPFDWKDGVKEAVEGYIDMKR